MHYISTAVIIFLCLGMPAGCRSLYDGFRTARIEECYKLSYTEQEECLRQAETGYDRYEQERREATRRQ